MGDSTEGVIGKSTAPKPWQILLLEPSDAPQRIGVGSHQKDIRKGEREE